MADHNDYGKFAEDAAAKFLMDKNYKIITRNYRFQKAEIDIIAEINGLIVITEVKARKNEDVMLPQDAVTKKKIKLLLGAADEFIKDRNEEVRFDIITVTGNENNLQINHIENAFEANDIA